MVVTCSSRLWRVVNPSVSFLDFFISGTQEAWNRPARKRRGWRPRKVFAECDHSSNLRLMECYLSWFIPVVSVEQGG